MAEKAVTMQGSTNGRHFIGVLTPDATIGQLAQQ